MTALKEYMRLETTGLWRSTPDGQRREVGVAFGDATLVIVDPAGRPLTHWSLPAVTRINPGIRPAVYSPDTDATESLELDDDLMITAIERVRQSVARRTPKPGRLRQSMIAGSVALVAGLALFWLPGALTRQTLSVVPPSKRSEIGATLLGHLQRVSGPTCRDPVGTRALADLNDRLFGAASTGQIVVIPGALPNPVSLPGGIIVISQAMVEDAADPAVVAGHVLSAYAGSMGPDPLAPVLSEGGLTGMFKLLATGDIPGAILHDYAEGLLSAQPTIPDATPRLIGAFDVTQIPVTPWASSLDPAVGSIQNLIDADPLAAQQIPPVIMTDDDWVSLQGICRS